MMTDVIAALTAPTPPPELRRGAAVARDGSSEGDFSATFEQTRRAGLPEAQPQPDGGAPGQDRPQDTAQSGAEEANDVNGLAEEIPTDDEVEFAVLPTGAARPETTARMAPVVTATTEAPQKTKREVETGKTADLKPLGPRDVQPRAEPKVVTGESVPAMAPEAKPGRDLAAIPPGPASGRLVAEAALPRTPAPELAGQARTPPAAIPPTATPNGIPFLATNATVAAPLTGLGAGIVPTDSPRSLRDELAALPTTRDAPLPRASAGSHLTTSVPVAATKTPTLLDSTSLPALNESLATRESVQDIEALSLARGQSASGVQQVTTQNALAGPLTARYAASQMAVAVHQQKGGPTEMSLNPPELGKVRMTLSTQDSGIVMMIQAERPETSDLLRRNIDALAQEFRNLGYGSIQFDFGGQPGQQAGQETAGDGAPSAMSEDFAADTVPDHPSPLQIARLGGLDLRI